MQELKRWLRERFADPTDARFRMPQDEGQPKAEVEDATLASEAAEGEKSGDDADDAASANGWSTASMSFLK